MSNLPCQIASAITALLLFSGSAWATSSVIQGDIKGPDGKALAGASVRAASTSNRSLTTMIKTDTKGHYIFKDLEAGSYDLTASAPGMAPTIATNVGTSVKGAVRIDFALKNQTGTASGAPVKKKAKKLVWMPPEMGSHLGGRWVEVDEDTANASANAQTVQKQDTIRKMLSHGGMNPTGN
jgi:Carboxypeptidase regulatory-like domain